MAAAAAPWVRPNYDVRPSSTEVSLGRMAGALEKLVTQQAPSNDALDFLAGVDAAELDAEVIKRRSLSIPLMQTTLDILREWSAQYGRS